MAIADLAYVDATGFHYADFPTFLAFYQAEYRAIYGADVYLEADSQDGQWVTVQAQSAYDLCALFAAVYNSFSPSTAQGDALSRNVKINGIKRRVPTFSTADLTIIGQQGTTLTDSSAEDANGNKWAIPSPTVIPVSETITVTATCQTIGAISAGANTINKIATPTRGWQTVNNALPATEGAPVESDAKLRNRQTASTALPSLSVLDGTIGAVARVDGVIRFRGYENDSNVTDADGMPAHNIAIVVEGGDVQDIAEAIAVKKTPGTGTFGTTSATVVDQYGVRNTINFFRPTPATIGVEVTIDPLPGYTSGYADLIKQAVADSINALLIGDDVLITRLYVPANLAGQPEGLTYDLNLVRTKKNAGAFGTSNIVLAFNEAAECTPADVTVITI